MVSDKRKKIGYALTFTMVMLVVFCATGLSSEKITYRMTVTGYKVENASSNLKAIHIDGCENYNSPGDPVVPVKVINLAVPPDTDIKSLRLNVTNVDSVKLTGSFDLVTATPAMANSSIVGNNEYWGEGKKIVNRKNRNVYGSNTQYPGYYASVLDFSQMRKWKYVRLAFFPVQYNPVTKKASLAEAIDIELVFERTPKPASSATGISVNDTAFDDVAGKILGNTVQANEWYASAEEAGDVIASPVTSDYCIITTNAIVSHSTELQNYVAHKESLGHSIQVITEDDFGALTGQAPNDTADKIRQWLIDNYANGIVYVLLIGNPDPVAGDVPMKMCYPKTMYPTPTDYYYADLTGNWDLDGDLQYGEYDGDGGLGGVDFAPEVYVGRIPVYNADYAPLDDILQKIIEYETDTGNDSWRRKALLPMSFSDSTTDGAYLAEAMKNDYLAPNGFSSYTLYQQGGFNWTTDSIFPSDAELRDGVTTAHWQSNCYGVVDWWAHGDPSSDLIGYNEIGWDGTIVTSSDCSSLNNDYPAHIFATSCSNGHPETSDNLGYALLKNGAISTVSASRTSWYALGEFSPGITKSSNANFGYYYLRDLTADNTPCGKALYDMKAVTGDEWGAIMWMNKYDFNLYGDPSTKLFNSVPEPLLETTITSGPASPCNDSNVTFTFEANKSVKCYYYKLYPIESGYTKTTLAEKYYNNITDGEYQFIVFARGTDDTFETTPARMSFTISIPPDEINTRIINGPGYVDHDGTVAFDYEANMPVQSFYYRLYGLESAYTKTTATTKSYTGLANGDYQFIVFARNSDGTLEASAARWTFKVLNEVNTTIVSGPASSDPDGNILFTWSADRPVQKYYYRLWPAEDGYTSTQTTSKSYSELTEGEYQFIVFARDTNGNLETTPATWNFTITQGTSSASDVLRGAVPVYITSAAIQNNLGSSMLVEQYPNEQANCVTIALFKSIPFTLRQDNSVNFEVAAACASGVNDDDLVVVLRGEDGAVPMMAFNGDDIDGAICAKLAQACLAAGDYRLEFYAEGTPTLNTVKISTAPLVDLLDAQINKQPVSTDIGLFKEFIFDGGGDLTLQIVAKADTGDNDDDVVVYLDGVSYGMNTPHSIDGDEERGAIRVLDIPVGALAAGEHTVSLVTEGTPTVYAVRVLKTDSDLVKIVTNEELDAGNTDIRFPTVKAAEVTVSVIATSRGAASLTLDGKTLARGVRNANREVSLTANAVLATGEHILSINAPAVAVLKSVTVSP